MTRFFMIEPGVVIAQQDNGPTVFDGTSAPGRRPVPSVSELGAALAVEVARSQELRAQMAENPPQKPTGAPTDFVAAVDKLVKLGVPYGTACQRISLEFPELYEQHRIESMLDS